MNKKNNNSQDNVKYQNYIKEDKIKLSRILFLLGFILYGSFIVVDYWALPSAFNTASFIRLFVVISMIFCYRLTYSKNFIKHYTPILTYAYSVSFLGVEAMLYLASPSDHAYSSYFAGLMIIMIALFSWTYLKLAITATISVCAILVYLYIELYVRDSVGINKSPIVITSIFLLTSSVIFGIFAQALRDSYLRQNFLLHQSLKEAYKAKAAEAKDNEYLANHDALTGLPNRRYMTELLENSMQEAKEKDKVLVIMFLDLNGFKQVNDIYGHAAGDKVLKVVAKRLELAIRSGDHIARLGGDEYLIGLMMNKDHLGEAENMTEKFAAIIAQPMNIEGIRVRVGSSIGLSAYPIHGNQISVLLDIADKRMYDAKKGRDSVSLQTIIEERDNKVAVFPGTNV